MKTKRHLYILWSVLSLGLFSCAVDPYELPLTRGKGVFKLGAPQSKPIKPSTTGDRKPSQRLPARTSSRRPYLPLTPETPRSVRPGTPLAQIQSDFAYLPDVSVTCSTSDFVVRVKPAFYGLGATPDELTLGSTCKSNGVLRPYGDLLFTYPLTECDVVRQSPLGYLVYKFVLHYKPSPKRFPSRAHRIDVDIECRYQRAHHVYQLTVQPTWETAIMHKRLKGSPSHFQLELMDDSWGRPADSQVYQLGKTVNFQVSAPDLRTEGKLYINSCYATPSSGSKSALKYIIIDNFGCMLDSKRDPGASQFISRTDKTLRFSMRAFQFTSDPDAEVSVHCKLFVTSGDPSPAHKSCTYRDNRWEALTGDNSICGCCDSRCVTSKAQRTMMEGSASSGSLVVSDQPYTAEDGFLPVTMTTEGRATSSHYTDSLESDENMWGSVDFVWYGDEEEDEKFHEDGKEGGVMTEPGLGKLGFREDVLEEEEEQPEVQESNIFEEDGSGYVEQESEEEEGFEGGKEINVQQDPHLNEKEGEASHHWAQMEQILPSEENVKHRGTGEEGVKTRTSEEEQKKDQDLIDDQEMIWFFSWG